MFFNFCNFRLNNSVSNSENGLYSMDNNQLYLTQAQQLQMLAQNSFAQNLVPSVLPEQIVSTNHRTNGTGGSSGRLIRGTHGGRFIASLLVEYHW